MVLYKELFLEEGLDTIQDGQDTGDVGNDLNQIADDVLNSHDDEVEYADEVPDVNPVDEAFKIMSDSEYNYNQLRRTIGLTELRAFSTGRDVVLEAVDIKGFFKHVKEMFMRMFESISKVVKDVLAKLDVQARLDKRFVDKRRNDIMKGNDKKWSHKGFKYDNTLNFVQAGVQDVTKAKSDELAMSDTVKRAIIKKITSGKVTTAADISDMKKQLIKFLRGSEEPMELKGTITPADVIGILSNARETSKIREDYGKLKKDYNTLIKELKKKEAEASKADFAEGSSLDLKTLNMQISMAKFEKNAQNTVQAVFLQIAKEKRAQARKIAHKMAGVGKKDEKAVGESSSLFGNLNFA